MTINAPAGRPAGHVRRGGREAGRRRRTKLGGTIQNDMLKEFIAQKEWIFPPEPVDAHHPRHDRSTAHATHAALEHHLDQRLPHPRGRARRRCRSSPSRSPTASATSQAGIEAGLDVDDFAPRLSFFFNVHNDFFEEIAKFRAARRMWARIMRSASARRTRAPGCCAPTARPPACSLTAQQPLQQRRAHHHPGARPAVLGGTQSLHTNSMDETLALPTRERGHGGAAHAADHRRGDRRGRTRVDPLGGSLRSSRRSPTRSSADGLRLHRPASTSMGGIVRAIELGFPQREIADAAYRYQKPARGATRRSSSASTSTSPRRAAHADPRDRRRGRASAGRAPARGKRRRATAPGRRRCSSNERRARRRAPT